MNKSILVLFLLLAPALIAQDRLELADGRKLRGEILSEKNGRLRFVTQEAELVEIESADLVERKEGRGLAKSLAEKLGDDPEDKDRILEVARIASADKNLRRDAPRLWRRLLALEEGDCDEARLALGQVRLGGTWYPDEKTGMKAWGEILAVEGFVPIAGGFVKKVELDAFRKNQASFLLDEERRWRPLEEIMMERGMRPWNGEWYDSATDTDLLDELKDLEAALGIVAQAGRDGVDEVYVVGKREVAEKLAKKITAARAWVALNLDAAAEPMLQQRGQAFALRTRVQYRDFLTRYRAKHGREPEDVKFCLDLGGMGFKRTSRVTDQEQPSWENTFVSGMVASLGRALGHAAFDVPAGFWVAAAMRGEADVMGSIRIHYVSPSRYDRAEEVRTQFESLDDARARLAEAKVRRGTRPMAELLNLSLNDLQSIHEVQGVFFLGFLLETRKEALLEFWKSRPEGKETAELRFARCFGAPIAELEKEFWTWFERLAR
ncbi:MAG: hypothetical protein H6807_03270 [Planctomycetes bacterium]|nr:hypothetical protein [Planctomycetota bacterium]